MDKQKNNYTGRFGDAEKRAKEETVRRAHIPQERRPSGFAAAGQAPKRSAVKSVEPRQPEKKKKQKAKKEKAEKTKRTEKKFSWMKLLTGVLIVILIALILIVIFGDRGTYHQMPTITRQEEQGSFAPEETPLPGVEEAIQ